MSLKFKLHSQTKNIILSLKGILYVLLLRSRRTFLEYLNIMLFVPILAPAIVTLWVYLYWLWNVSNTSSTTLILFTSRLHLLNNAVSRSVKGSRLWLSSTGLLWLSSCYATLHWWCGLFRNESLFLLSLNLNITVDSSWEVVNKQAWLIYLWISHLYISTKRAFCYRFKNSLKHLVPQRQNSFFYWYIFMISKRT